MTILPKKKPSEKSLKKFSNIQKVRENKLIIYRKQINEKIEKMMNKHRKSEIIIKKTESLSVKKS